MDEEQKQHLKAYGLAYWALEREVSMRWLLNYRGGSFLMPYAKILEEECKIRGISYAVISNSKAQAILQDIEREDNNKNTVLLEKAPKIAVYTPSGKQPWDDAVTLVLTYAEIPYDEIYDSAIVYGALDTYDWLHLHHEDFTGQYGKFYAGYKHTEWYKKQVHDTEKMAEKLGFSKVSKLKLQVALKIKDYVNKGGFLFTMCSGTDSFDIALSAQHTDICESFFDGDVADSRANEKLDYTHGFAFKDYALRMNPLEYEFSDIDATMTHARLGEATDYFTLFDFSAKWDLIPTILTQNHERYIKGFFGQTTSFYSKYIKTDVIVMGQQKSIGVAKYIHGNYGEGSWSFYGGHDPEDYKHRVGDPPTDLALYPNSPGYRLILNNILFPSVKKQKQKT